MTWEVTPVKKHHEKTHLYHESHKFHLIIYLSASLEIDTLEFKSFMKSFL